MMNMSTPMKSDLMELVGADIDSSALRQGR